MSLWRAAHRPTSLAIEAAFAHLGGCIGAITGPAVPIHGDTHFGNVLAEGGRFVCLTDWEFGHPGHPAEDLAFCRQAVETVLPWEAFLARYRDAGGPDVTDAALRFFAIWGKLRNAVFGMRILRRFLDGAGHDIDSLAIALHSLPRVEAQLAALLSPPHPQGETHDGR